MAAGRNKIYPKITEPLIWHSQPSVQRIISLTTVFIKSLLSLSLHIKSSVLIFFCYKQNVSSFCSVKASHIFFCKKWLRLFNICLISSHLINSFAGFDKWVLDYNTQTITFCTTLPTLPLQATVTPLPHLLPQNLPRLLLLLHPIHHLYHHLKDIHREIQVR